MAVFLLRPFVGVQVITSAADATGSHLVLISTGLLPITVSADSGGSVNLVDGQVGVLTTHPAHAAQAVQLSTAVHLSLWGWLLLGLFWLTPVIWAVLVGAPAESARRPAHAESDDHSCNRSHPSRVGALAVVLLVAPALATGAAGAGHSTSAAFTARITNSVDTVGSAPYFTCTAAAVGYASYFAYPLATTSPTNGVASADVSGNGRTGTYHTNFASSTSKACSRDAGGSVVLSGTATTTYVSTPNSVSNPTVFTLQIWFKKTTVGGGRLIGFGPAKTGTSSRHDRHLYLTNSGQVVFAVNPGAVKTIVSPGTYLNGSWHQAVATLSGSGMALYVDGSVVATDGSVTGADNYTGFWRVGYDSLASSGTTQPAHFYYTGSLAYAAVFTTALTAAQVKNLWAAGQ